MRYRYEKKNGPGGLYAEITGCDMPLGVSVIPSVIDGLPVQSLGNQAFARRKDLEEIVIPDSVARLGRFCFYGCTSLRQITLTDAVQDVGDGSIRECSSLRWISVTVAHGSFRVIRDLMEDSMAAFCLRIRVGSGEDRTEFCLYMPAWHPEDREDTHARAIHPGIGGAGYAYRQTVTRTGVSLREYDRLFNRAVSDGVRTAAAVALWRLATPYRLSGQAKEAYAAYLKVHARDVLALVAAEDRRENRELLQVFLEKAQPDCDTAAEAVRQAAESGKTQICGILMAYEHAEKRKDSSGPEVFTL